jgi:hypothetical protein
MLSLLTDEKKQPFLRRSAKRRLPDGCCCGYDRRKKVFR